MDWEARGIPYLWPGELSSFRIEFLSESIGWPCRARGRGWGCLVKVDVHRLLLLPLLPLLLLLLLLLSDPELRRLRGGDGQDLLMLHEAKLEASIEIQSSFLLLCSLCWLTS